jgi:hypothetical protein
MADFFDYVKWRGDLSQSACKFSEVDFGIFSQIVLLDLSNVFSSPKDRYTIKEAFNKYVLNVDLDKELGVMITNKINHIFQDISLSPRYENLILTAYKEVSDEITGEQFCGLTIELSKDTALVLFSGTDDSIHGWEENFSMIYESTTKAQRRSLRYLNEIEKNYSKIYLAGHSKGGNLVAYCIKACSDAVFSKIKKALSFDAPGLVEIIDDERLNRFNKLKEYCPDNSLIGRLLNHYGKLVIIESEYKGAFQHDLFGWCVERNQFKKKLKFLENSTLVEKKISSVLKRLTKTEKERFVKIIFEILYSTGAKCLTDLKSKRADIFKCYFRLSPDDKKFFKKIFLWELVADKNIRKMFASDLSDKKAVKKFKEGKPKDK